MAVPRGPGIGVEVDEERLEKVAVRKLASGLNGTLTIA
jgi:L-alanine-DL-glutamate epimerase-like enolase superfamily enzyme